VHVCLLELTEDADLGENVEMQQYVARSIIVIAVLL
jgi:hypothetical protein